MTTALAAALASSILGTFGFRLPPLVIVFQWLPTAVVLYWANRRSIATVYGKKLNRVPSYRLALSGTLAGIGALAAAVWAFGTIPDLEATARQIDELQSQSQQAKALLDRAIPDVGPAQRQIDETDRDLHDIQRLIICEADSSCGTRKEGEGTEFRRKKEREQQLRDELGQREKELDQVIAQAERSRADAADARKRLDMINEKLPPLQATAAATWLDQRVILLKSTMQRDSDDQPLLPVVPSLLAALLLLGLDWLPLRQLCRRECRPQSATTPNRTEGREKITEAYDKSAREEESLRAHPPITAIQFDARNQPMTDPQGNGNE